LKTARNLGKIHSLGGCPKKAGQRLEFPCPTVIFAVPFKENNTKAMKKDIHPDYQEVVFYDTSSDYKFLTRSTLKSKEKIKWEDGKEYPLVKVEVSSASHPFFTGKKLFVDTAGRVEKFQKKYQKKS
jgi:large subunit ribosomal protein L31